MFSTATAVAEELQGFDTGLDTELLSYTGLFETCQAKIGLWKQIEVQASVVERGEVLGRGTYAEVFKARAFGVDCAVKLYRSTATPKQLRDAFNEIKITGRFLFPCSDIQKTSRHTDHAPYISTSTASLDHPCTLRILGWARTPLQTITELCCGDLRAFYLDKIDEYPYDELTALRLLKVYRLIMCSSNLQHHQLTKRTLRRPQESASGLLYLHSVRIIHRDVKPANILVGGANGSAKVADYGISRILDTSLTMTHKGTMLYQAPEVSRGERYGFAADVYSLGLTIYELCKKVGFEGGRGRREGGGREGGRRKGGRESK